MASAGVALEAPHCWELSSKQAINLVDDPGADVIKILPLTSAALAEATEGLGALAKSWVTATRFKAKSGEVCLLPSEQGSLASVLLGLDKPDDMWAYAALVKALPPRTYKLEPARAGGSEAAGDAAAVAPESHMTPGERAALGFLLGGYSFDRYKKPQQAPAGDGSGGSGGPGAASDAGPALLVWPEGCDRQAVLALHRAFVWCRALITTPAEDLGPQHLAAEAAALAAHHGASFSALQGEALLEAGYPAIHTVGRASYRPPALATLEWSPKGVADPSGLPLLALVGKGVCFDTGGLDIKTAAGMKNMKKDMGGAALVLALAHLVMSGGLPVRLLLLVPTVENSIAGNAYRPLDVLRTRAGISVENGNTDAEGRLILCDALAEAAARRPDLLIDAATLTGAARVALGPDLPAVFSSDDAVWRALEQAGRAEDDPVWRLPLHAPYRKLLDSKVADVSSTGNAEGLAGAIIAALFLAEFVKEVPRWLHLDTSAYVAGSSVGPGRPEGGEAVALRALWRLLLDRYKQPAQQQQQQ